MDLRTPTLIFVWVSCGAEPCDDVPFVTGMQYLRVHPSPEHA